MKIPIRFSAVALIILNVYSASSWGWDHRAGHIHGHRDWHPGGFHNHPSFGFYFGAPLYAYPYYRYPYPYYFPPPVVTVPSTPPVYIQQTPPPATQPYPAGNWYYCRNPEGYYPYVNECPSGWQPVSPTPAPTH